MRLGPGTEFTSKSIEFGRRQFSRASEQVAARRFQQRTARAERSPELAGTRILILSMRDWSVHVQVEALIARSLDLHGAEVVMLGCGGGLEICDRVNTWEGPPMPCRSCSKYVHDSLRSHDLPYLDLVTRFGEESWPELDELDLEGLREVNYGGLPLGQMVDLSVKWFLTSESLEEDPLAVRTYRSFLRSARRITDAATKVLDEVEPDHIIMLNGLFLMESIVAEFARSRGIRVTTYERAFVPGSFIFSEGENAGFLRMDEVWEDWKAVPLTSGEEAELDRYLLDRRVGVRTGENLWQSINSAISARTRPGRRAILFTNLVWDVAVVNQDIAFPSIVDWIVAAVEHFRDRPDDELLIRIHPAEAKLSGRESRERMLDRISPLIGSFPPNVTVIPAEADTSSYVLMEDADFGLVYSSTTGMEMALAGKPVIVAARTHYRDRGFTIDVSDRTEFRAAIDRLCADPTTSIPDRNLARRYAHLFFFKAPYADLGVSEPIRGLVSLDVKEVSDLRTPGYERLVAAITGSGGYLPRPAGSTTSQGQK